MIKCLFSDILIGEEFSLQETESNTILIKEDDKTYRIKGQTRIWKLNNEKMQCYKTRNNG